MAITQIIYLTTRVLGIRQCALEQYHLLMRTWISQSRRKHASYLHCSCKFRTLGSTASVNELSADGYVLQRKHVHTCDT